MIPFPSHRTIVGLVGPGIDAHSALRPYPCLALWLVRRPPPSSCLADACAGTRCRGRLCRQGGAT